MMKLNAFGMDYRHPADFEINRPCGSGDNLLIIFKSRAQAEINGITVNAEPDSALLYKKGQPQIYRAGGEIYINHFIHMDCCEDDVFHTETGMPFGEVLGLSDISDIEEIMRHIGQESLSGLPSSEKITDLLLRMLFIKLGNSSRKGEKKAAAFPHGAALSSLRAALYNNAGKFSSVNGLAAAVNLSPSYFQRLYKEQFGISCYEDLISARIKAAQYYLKQTDMPVKEIAGLCGYENGTCFMRRFKEKTGATPTEYRQTHRNPIKA